MAALSVVPFFLCFIYIIFNFQKCLSILSKDNYFLNLIKSCLIFTLYQIFVSYFFLGIVVDGQEFYFIFANVKYWFGIWLLVPAYIFILKDRQNLFLSILTIVIIILILYYLSVFGIYSFFKINLIKRSTVDDDLWRLFVIDLRQITQIFVYLLPLVIFFPI